MKKHNLNKYSKSHLGDYIIMCDICGMPCWASESTKLDIYTGRGGLIVCPQDVDQIDYGLVPYKIPAEKSPPVVRTNIYMNTTVDDTYSPITDFSNPDLDHQNVASPTWDEVYYHAWDSWELPWGDLE